MKSTKMLFVLLSSSFLFPIASFATSTTPAVTPRPTGSWNIFRREIREETKDMVKEIKEIRVESRQEVRTGGQQLRTTATQNRDTLKATTTQSRLEMNRKRIQASYNGLTNSFTVRKNTYLDYLTRIQTRLNDKKVKLPNNQNLTDAQAALDNVKNVLSPKFDTDLTAFKTQANLIATSTDPKSLVPQLKTASKLVSEDLKNIRNKLIDTLRLMVKAR